MEESIRIQSFEKLPSAKEFESMIEPRNVPAVFNGCIKDWKAFSKWNPSNGGLEYLQERVGSCVVEAMLSQSAPVFYGDLGRHERVPLPFSTFVEFCKQHVQNKEGRPGACFESESHGQPGSDSEHGYLHLEDAPQQIYLAQVPIMNFDNEERVQLGTLSKDIQTPESLETKALASINLWMNNAQSRSSTHYDPHHNLLCIVSGCKQVYLWPPSASPCLYPMPIYGEASNHSFVALENPDFSVYPRAEQSMEFSQKVVLHAGDALFIPEGWFHQVDSDDLTIAVNFWWQSNITSCMSAHMDTYYMRRILRRLTDKEMDQLLQKTRIAKKMKRANELPSNGQAGVGKEDSKEKNPRQKTILQELEPAAVHVLHELVSLVHTSVSVPNQDKPLLQSTSVTDFAAEMQDKCEKLVTAYLEDDPVAKLLWGTESHTLQNVFLAMAHNFPRTLETLVLHVLSPVGAEVLTQKFDEIDQQTAEGERRTFFEVFYSAFDDQSAAMDSILKGKELFALQAFKNVLDKYLGVNLESLNLKG
ncbi:2-oxoglutarate (2OG) and Fe(II)-dependent oxygenase superfamily protein [Quillaja saponaria]|uniref:2-oxoglutarate (2OG) and Fe(II)-dependent oxygenase superfamily protein n=1 Tax=Quillaja saponaria TaxID=32244 RepID=A0AAD7Q0S1_QUISA|nr:2-oxoglutarate (2OG) and Fe(II)-dependent oxygenase superfamily protein [Quillaja saponaria]